MSQRKRSNSKTKTGVTKSSHLQGKKLDLDKLKWYLLPWREVKQVLKVFMHGAKKYTDFNWCYVENAKQRYFDAAMRHIIAWEEGRFRDKESGKPHLAHAVCCLLIIMWHDNTDQQKKDRRKDEYWFQKYPRP